ncbi:putative membrane protein [Acidovorax sp. 69]|uniref:COG4648 family protein n=1 Tax=Acidovorax sp. 69 TaxID=2035202 RepID=UPI000C232713|nr:hypothetical protein [Acidovorax sp. 69]PJI98650.1 putative membrane protein [Acidovorax sp. 69]
MHKIVTTVLVVLTVLYPLGVYLALGNVAPQWLAVVLIALAVLRALVTRQRFWWAVASGAAVLALAAWWRDDALAVKLYPVLVNAVLLVVFAVSLRHPPTVVERLARLSEPELPPSGVRYTRKVTAVWCVFFVVNGAVAAYTAAFSSDATWALYNGLIAYGLMGCLMGVEWIVRQWVKRSNTVVSNQP